MIDRVKGGGSGQKLYGSYYLSEESLHTKFQTPSSFPSCSKVCGGWVLKLGFDFKPKLNNRTNSMRSVKTIVILFMVVTVFVGVCIKQN